MMDVYEFSERDDQSYSQTKSNKQKKSKCKTVTKLKPKRGRKRRVKLTDTYLNNKSAALNPPIKLKLIRDPTDSQIFKSVQIISDISQSTEFSFDYKQQSLLRCKLLDEREFTVNDIVWAKISGYPYWPSKILSINLSNQKSSIKSSSLLTCLPRVDLSDEYIACVEWFAYDQISYVNCINLSHFQSDFSNKYNSKIKNKKYFEAVNEAKNLSEENQQNYDYVANQQTVDSVHSYETTEADTSSTLPSHNFTSPESNQSVQSYCHRPLRSNPLSNQSDRSVHYNIELPPTLSIDTQNAHKLTNNGTCSTIISQTNWELPDLGSNLDFESNNHIPEFSDYEDEDCENIDIAKIEFMIDETHKVINT